MGAVDKEAPSGDLLLPREVAHMFRVDPKTVTRWANKGMIRSFRTPGGHRRFHRGDVEKMIELTGRRPR